jgi:hypothetical protein
MKFHRVSGIGAIALASAVLASPASAQPNPADYPTQNHAQTPGNTGGVIFHPHGDGFEIWDNDKNGLPVNVYYNYVGVKDKWKVITSREHHTLIRRNLAEFPHRIYFYIEASDRTSQIVKYRTYGT